jgi:hypothetical protein
MSCARPLQAVRQAGRHSFSRQDIQLLRGNIQDAGLDKESMRARNGLA